MDLSKAKLFMFDVDGVFITGVLEYKTKVLGGYRLMKKLKAMGRGIALIGSGSNWSTYEYWAMMRQLGFPVEFNEVWPSVRVAGEYLRKALGKADVYVLGEQGAVFEMRRFGHRITSWRKANAVLVSHDRTVSYRKLSGAVAAVARGALFVAANKVRWYYTEDGPVISPGAIVAAIEFQTRREAVVVGKPSLIHFQTVLEHFGMDPAEAVMVGDTVESDLMPAKKLGVTTVLVNAVERWERQNIEGVDYMVSDVDQLADML